MSTRGLLGYILWGYPDTYSGCTRLHTGGVPGYIPEYDRKRSGLVPGYAREYRPY